MVISFSDMIKTAYYFLQHMYTLVPHHVDDDMRWMADHGVDSIAIGILEQDFQASWRNLDHLFAAAQRQNIAIRFTPSRWCGLFAGAGKVPSMWACNNPHTWSLDEDGQPRVNKYSGIICSIHHPAVFDFISTNIEYLITRWPVAGIIWDELKTLHLKDHHPLAQSKLGQEAKLEQHVQATADFYDRVNQHAKSLRPDLVTSMFIYAHCDGAEVKALSSIKSLDEYGCDGRPWTKADEASEEIHSKYLVTHGPRHMDAAHQAGKRSFMLIENLDQTKAQDRAMDHHLPAILQQDIDHLVFYYYPRNLEDPQGNMQIISKHLMHA